MPVLRGTVTFARFRVEYAEAPPSDVKRWLSRGLQSQAFEPIDKRTDEERAVGFVELEDNDSTEFSPGRVFHGEYALLAWRIDTIKIPSAVLKAELTQWAAAFEKENERAPTRGEKAERRAAIRQALRTRAVPITKVHDVAWNLKAQQLQIWASSRKVVDEVVLAMESAFRLKLHAMVPAAVASRRGVADELLGPTPELVGMELAGPKEVSRGKA